MALVATSLDPDLVRVHARARLPTHHGAFEIVAFETFLDGPSGLNSAGERIDDVALVAGGTDLAEPVDLRIHSECLSGDVFGSLRCDCRDQLEVAFSRIAART
jgi:GTP cyclohydrolase II